MVNGRYRFSKAYYCRVIQLQLHSLIGHHYLVEPNRDQHCLCHFLSPLLGIVEIVAIAFLLKHMNIIPSSAARLVHSTRPSQSVGHSSTLYMCILSFYISKTIQQIEKLSISEMIFLLHFSILILEQEKGQPFYQFFLKSKKSNLYSFFHRQWTSYYTGQIYDSVKYKYFLQLQYHFQSSYKIWTNYRTQKNRSILLFQIAEKF